MNSKLIINSIVFAGAFLVVWFLLLPTWGDVSTLRKEVGLKKTSIELEKKIIEKLNSINQVLDSQKSNVERLEQAIPSSEFKPELISIMESLANQNGLSLVSVNIEAPNETTGVTSNRRGQTVSKETISKLLININASGTYSSFKSWLAAVQKSLRIIDVGQISFSITKKKTAEGESLPNIDPAIDYNIGMKTYILKK
ncbi:MAG: type 4a pilus biogenesis protein PilO [bacterium]|nr:type 4a pilus biogenesis protein PilO [bacterium]